MKLNVLNWNIGGAKFLETKLSHHRKRVHAELNQALRQLVLGNKPQPDIVALQEIIRYRRPKDDRETDLIEPIEGYEYCPISLIDTQLLSSKAKWNKVRACSDWPSDTYFAQGNGFLFKKDAPRFPIWDLSNLDQPSRACREHNFVERVSLESGLYFGDRDTEPRASLVAHLILDPDVEKDRPKSKRKPLDIFVVNVHLTTLNMEREGIPEIDERASGIRKTQLEIVFNGIVSRYNSWRQQRYPERGRLRKPERHETFNRHYPVWILAGDFNFTPGSEEYQMVQRRNFIDAVPQKGQGTKARGSGNPARLTLDYIFAGPKFIALDPLIEEFGIENDAVHHNVVASDHYPMFAQIPLELPSPT